MSLNKAMLIGNVGKEPNIRYLDNGVCTAAFPLATTTPGYTLPNGTQVPERTEWHNIMLWRKLAEVAEKYVHKGDKLYIEGEIRRKEMQMLSSKPIVASVPTSNTETDKQEENATTSDKSSLPF